MFIHLANILILLSFTLRDVLWLRCLNVAASLCFITYFLRQTPPLWSPIAWNLLFLLVNVFQIWRLYQERRPISFQSHEEALYRLTFRSLTPYEFSQLLPFTRWRSLAPNELLLQQGIYLEHVYLVTQGTLQVELSDQSTIPLKTGQFAGELSFLTGQQSSANVYAREPAQVVYWNRETLADFLRKHPSIANAIQRILGDDLAQKLQTTRNEENIPPKRRPLTK